MPTAQIRARRLAQLQAQGGGGGGPSRGGLPSGMGEGPGGGGPGGEKKSQEQIEAERRAEEEQLRVIMSSVLEPAARERRKSCRFRPRLALLARPRRSHTDSAVRSVTRLVPPA